MDPGGERRSGSRWAWSAAANEMNSPGYSETELPDSLWAATAAPAPHCPPLVGEVSVDACVVGGGFTGLSTALYLAEAGLRVVLLEASEPGFGASGRNGGQVIPGLKLAPDAIIRRYGTEQGARIVELVSAAPDLVFRLVERHGIACQAQRSGWIRAAHAASALPALEALVAQWTARGAPVELLGRAKLARLLGTGVYAGGYLDHRGGQLQPLAFARGLAAAAIGAGASICARSPATRMAPVKGGWRVQTPGGEVRSEFVILATNAYTDGLWPGLARSVIPVFSYQIATRPLAADERQGVLPEGHCVSDTRRLLRYFRLDHTGRLVMGGRGSFVDAGDARLFEDLQDALRATFPGLRESAWEYRWAGKVALTADAVPHIHELAPGVYAALGYNGRGVALATATGRVLAALTSGACGGALAFPVTAMRALPLHGWRRPVLELLVGWRKLMDDRETRSRR